MGSKNAGQNQADKAAKQIADAEARVTDRFGRVRQKALSNEIAKGIPTNVPGVNQAYGKTALGQMGINPNMIGSSNLPSSVFGNKGYKGLDKSYTDLQGNQVIGNTQGLLSAPEIERIGELRDLYAGSEDEQTSADLERLSRFNRVLGLRPTAGMNLADSLKQNFTGLEAKRDFARLGNTAKGIMNLMPGKALATGLFNAVTGSNIPSQFSMSPINYDITDRMFNFYGDEGFNPMLSSEDQEMFGDSFLDRALFGTPALGVRPVTNEQGFTPIQSVTETTNMPGMEGIPDMFPDNQGVPTYTIDAIQNDLRKNKFRNFVEDAYNPNLPNQFFDDSLDTEDSYDIRDFLSDAEDTYGVDVTENLYSDSTIENRIPGIFDTTETSSILPMKRPPQPTTPEIDISPSFRPNVVTYGGGLPVTYGTSDDDIMQGGYVGYSGTGPYSVDFNTMGQPFNRQK
jgi:hypothetical protein